MEPLEDPVWDEEEPDARAEPVDPELLARRRQFRSWVGRGIGGLALFTLIAPLARGVGQQTTLPESRSSAGTSDPHAVSAPAAALAATPLAVTSAAPIAPVVAATPPPLPATARETLRDIKLPPVADDAGLARWSSLARSATAEEFADVDAELAKLIKTRRALVRDRLRLARALLWRERGRGSDVQPVFDDLALHAKSADVRVAARTHQTH
jgi:hypothetical protein